MGIGQRGRWIAGLALCGLIAVPKAGSAQEGSYRFTRIAQTGSSEVSLGLPVINNRGQVAFFREAPEGVRVFRLDGRRRVRIWRRATTQGMGSLAISDRGHVAFPVSLAVGREVILRGRGGSVVTIASTIGGPFDSFTFAVSVNRKGIVGFGPDLKNGDEGVFLGRGGRPAPLYLDSSSPLSDNNKPSVNDRGWVGFAAGSGDEEGVFVWDGRRFVTVLDTRSPQLFQVFSDVSLNEGGSVAFTGTVDDPADPTQPGPLTLFAGRPGSLRQVLQTTGEYLNLPGNPSINDRNEVAFLGERASTGPDPAHDLLVASGTGIRKVVGTGDALDGSRVVSLRLADDRVLNNRGQLVFGAHLEDGRFGLYRADRR